MVVDAAAAEALAALKARDWGRLRSLLHPYLRWTDVGGREVRGRKKVMLLLEHMEDADPPASVELRDGQIYRWRSK